MAKELCYAGRFLEGVREKMKTKTSIERFVEILEPRDSIWPFPWRKAPLSARQYSRIIYGATLEMERAAEWIANLGRIGVSCALQDLIDGTGCDLAQTHEATEFWSNMASGTLSKVGNSLCVAFKIRPSPFPRHPEITVGFDAVELSLEAVADFVGELEVVPPPFVHVSMVPAGVDRTNAPKARVRAQLRTTIGGGLNLDGAVSAKISPSNDVGELRAFIRPLHLSFRFSQSSLQNASQFVVIFWALASKSHIIIGKSAA